MTDLGREPSTSSDGDPMNPSHPRHRMRTLNSQSGRFVSPNPSGTPVTPPARETST